MLRNQLTGRVGICERKLYLALMAWIDPGRLSGTNGSACVAALLPSRVGWLGDTFAFFVGNDQRPYQSYEGVCGGPFGRGKEPTLW